MVTGGLGGVMEAACRGARSRRGRTLGILPGDDRDAANGWVEVAVATGWASCATVWSCAAPTRSSRSAAAYGTLSEIALALKTGRPVVGLGTWDVHGVEQVGSPREAVERVCALLELPLR